MFYTTGIDVGCSSIKTVVMSFSDDGGGEVLLAKDTSKIRKRNVKDVVLQSHRQALEAANVDEDAVSYVATTGEGELVDFRKGHFYSMTTHARGALFLLPEARAVVDVGALHAKALVMDERSKVLAHRMTSQCASGSGQFLENISRYLGVPVEEIGPLSLEADDPEMISGICAVLGETDVINMVSRGIPAGRILKGVHVSIAKRLTNLLRALGAEGDVMITGGLANDVGFVTVMQELADKANLEVKLCTHEMSIYAGAIGAAMWGGFRHVRLRDGARGGREAA
jgi:benzoyl-CoA reductase subunit D